jgi:hypothetical protein
VRLTKRRRWKTSKDDSHPRRASTSNDLLHLLHPNPND